MADTVLITGASGFAGGFLVEWYANQGWRVVGTYRSAPPDRAWIGKHIELVEVDLMDAARTRQLVASENPRVIHHLAAQSSVSLSWANPLETLQCNTAMQWNLLEAVAGVCPGARVVIVGSSDEYGNVLPAENPVDETHPLKPASPYALSKVVQDLMGRQYAETHGLHTTRVRPFLQTGPRRSDRFAAGSFARQIAEIAVGVREPVVSVGSIDLLRDFTDVRDAVRGYAVIAERGVAGEVYNLASGAPHSLRDMLRIMLETAGVDAQIVHDPALAREGETPLLVGNPAKVRAATGWEPEITFEASAADTMKYWLNRIRVALAHEGRS